MKEIVYRFSPNISAKKIRVIKLTDKLLSGIFRKGDKKVIDNQVIKEVTIVQLAHIGDLILMLPALKKLKVLSNYKINLVVNSQNFAIASKLKFVDSVTVADAPWFARGKKGSYFGFLKQLRKIKTDFIFDVRGDLRNNLFIKLFTRHKVFAGYNVGGGGALLDEVFPFDHTGHSTGLTKPLFNYLNLPDFDFSNFWEADDIPYEIVNNHVFPDNFMVMHLGAGAESRRWPVQSFIETLKVVSKDIPVYVLGTKQDATQEEIAAIIAMPNVVNCVGAYSIPQSIYILKRSSLFMGLESGFSHIAAMLRKKSFILFSGTSNINVWKPYSFTEGQVTLLNHVVECDLVTGCGKFTCDNNICMKHIYPFEVSSLIQSHLQNTASVA
ncbi:glycosyltransferase family 9 protein [Mucilaginibacter sp. ZT4R22]|uniref:Glycosyltransferase family 9 protein n=1 Tax=Mucilaginibacter pankratovii TaxID=2772110 RepID=A0ABR7WLR6_9SPHI|nr:glycosyltransferase family 9 protein [Mucilaginibacter pankratovii]MBD1363063.1 glycosyltransferase family 9 protein [Mucilaginibacter pankratovii]